MKLFYEYINGNIKIEESNRIAIIVIDTFVRSFARSLDRLQIVLFSANYFDIYFDHSILSFSTILNVYDDARRRGKISHYKHKHKENRTGNNYSN